MAYGREGLELWIGVPHVYQTLFQIGYAAAFCLVSWPEDLVLLVGHYPFKTCMLLGQSLAFAINHKAWIGLIKFFSVEVLVDSTFYNRGNLELSFCSVAEAAWTFSWSFLNSIMWLQFLLFSYTFGVVSFSWYNVEIKSFNVLNISALPSPLFPFSLFRPAHFFKTFSFIARFSPEALNWLFIKGLLGWCLQVALLKVTLLSLGSGEAPLLDIVAYAGYTFTGMCLAVLGKIIWGYSYYALMPWTCLCMGIFLVKTMKRVLFAEVRSYDSSKHHYLLLFIALAQFPLFTWLGNISVNWLI